MRLPGSLAVNGRIMTSAAAPPSSLLPSPKFTEVEFPVEKELRAPNHAQNDPEGVKVVVNLPCWTPNRLIDSDNCRHATFDVLIALTRLNPQPRIRPWSALTLGALKCGMIIDRA